MAWQDVTQVNDGQDYDGDRHAEIRLAIEQLQAALGPDESFPHGWRGVASGTFDGVTGATLPIPEEVQGFRRYRLTVLGRVTVTSGTTLAVAIRPNADSGATYVGVTSAFPGDGGARTIESGWGSTSAPLVRWGQVSRNRFQVELTTDNGVAWNIESRGNRISTSAAAMTRFEADGRVEPSSSDLVSIQVFRIDGGGGVSDVLTACTWWMEAYFE